MKIRHVTPARYRGSVLGDVTAPNSPLNGKLCPVNGVSDFMIHCVCYLLPFLEMVPSPLNKTTILTSIARLPTSDQLQQYYSKAVHIYLLVHFVSVPTFCKLYHETKL
ncbi:hypothetical protein M5K25_021122 [Dendrobium thyrsiflorum]|uniref:Uncharacterized protein n=1 Tax=Dendrobium thyrsiflorum TaxID=117978 RepID=A0ABD0UCF9_DENTH